MTLVFVNTRAQAESIFQELWRLNEDGLPIALHHGSLDAAQRRKVEAAMAARPAQGGRLHLDARSRHRLGRRRSRHQCRRAEGREPSRPAHRPRQSPARRALPRHSRARQPLRGAGMPRRRRRRARGRAGHGAGPRRRARRALPAHSRHGLRRAFRRRRPLRRGAHGRALRETDRAKISTPRSPSSRPAAMR